MFWGEQKQIFQTELKVQLRTIEQPQSQNSFQHPGQAELYFGWEDQYRRRENPMFKEVTLYKTKEIQADRLQYTL